MDIRPILSTLRRHKTAASLIVLEIALSCAIICNALFLIGERAQRIDLPSGVAEQELLDIQITGIGSDANAMALTREDVAALRAIPGVTAVAAANQVPFGHSSWNSSLSVQPDVEDAGFAAAMYMGDETLRATLGARLVAGRDFLPEEMIDYDPAKGFGELLSASLIVTQAVADQLFPGKSAVGQVVYFGDPRPLRIVGVVDRLMRPNLGGSDSRGEHSVLMSVRIPYTVGGHYLLRAAQGDRERVLASAAAVLERNSPNRIIESKETLETMRQRFFNRDRAMVWLLVAVCVALLVVTALGIVGLASFWVQQRTKQIGVRRALGATRGQILRYFQTENFLLATIGIVIGMMLAFGLNQLLMERYELPRLPAIYLPIGAIALWLLGQVAVLGPARRASAVPPAVATRSV